VCSCSCACHAAASRPIVHCSMHSCKVAFVCSVVVLWCVVRSWTICTRLASRGRPSGSTSSPSPSCPPQVRERLRVSSWLCGMCGCAAAVCSMCACAGRACRVQDASVASGKSRKGVFLCRGCVVPCRVLSQLVVFLCHIVARVCAGSLGGSLGGAMGGGGGPLSSSGLDPRLGKSRSSLLSDSGLRSVGFKSLTASVAAAKLVGGTPGDVV
jgi:hypothetical protein